MATINGSTVHANWDFKLEVTEGTPSVADNTSPLTVKAYLGRNGSSSYMWGANIKITVKVTGCTDRNITYSNSNRVDVGVGQWLLLGSTTFSAVPHNSDGKKTVAVSASFTNNISPKSGSASGSVKLTDIPRKSSLTVANGTLGTAQALTVTRASSSFTHTITYKCGTATGTIATKSTATSFNFTPPISLASQNTTGTSVSITYTLTTYSGSTDLGSNSYTKSCSIPASVKPTCSVQVIDGTNYQATYGNLVKGLSTLQIKVTGTPSYGSAIASYSATADGKKYTASEFTTPTLSTSGTVTVSATVTDKRNRTSSAASASLTVIDYNAPTVTSLSVNRCDSSGAEDDKGEYIKVVFSAAITPLNNKNSAAYKLRYKKTAETSYTEVTFSDLAGQYSVSNKSHIFAADGNSSYNVEIVATDDIQSVALATSASTAFTLINWKADGTGFAFGKVAEKSDTLQIALSVEVGKPIELADSEKVGLSLTSSFTPYSNSQSNRPWCRKTAAGFVEVHGTVSPASASNTLGSATSTTICTLPEGYRPAEGFYQLCQGSDVDFWLLSVAPDGNVGASRYRNLSGYTTPGTGNWMPFHFSFVAEQ